MHAVDTISAGREYERAKGREWCERSLRRENPPVKGGLNENDPKERMILEVIESLARDFERAKMRKGVSRRINEILEYLTNNVLV
jgi:hypothetical protein